jgi:phosphoserine aminotransferase
MERAHNFNAGPAALPQEVLQTAASQMLDYNGSGIGVMEMSHRSAAFKGIVEGAENTLRELLGLPSNYRVLFVQGGGTGQFAAVPMNLMRTGTAAYIETGTWSTKAVKEARKYGEPVVVASSAADGFASVPDLANLAVPADASYLYICQNETIGGIAYHELPPSGNVPLVADVSSCFLSEPCDPTRYGLMWAGAQKNVGPAGVTIVVVRDDLVGAPAFAATPTVMDYQVMADSNSLYNTPPCWGIYICGLVFEWIKNQGGLAAMGEANHAKADLLYAAIDESDLFQGRARACDRSIMNVTFSTGSAELDAAFVEESARAGFVGLKGHRSVGGIRASLYNAVPRASVEALVAFMKRFELDHRS